MSQEEIHEPGSPHADQRRKEKARLQSLNDRFEAVLGHIRRENFVLSRNLKDHAEQARSVEEMSALLAEEQAILDKKMEDAIALNTQQIGIKIRSAHATAAIDDELARFPTIERWDSPDVAGDESGDKLAELALATARKEIDILKASAHLEEKIKCNEVVQTSLELVRADASNVTFQTEKLKKELLALEQKLNDMKAKNEVLKEQASHFDTVKTDDAMYERIFTSLDEKEKQLQKELLEKLDQRARELDESRKSPADVVANTPIKLDLVANRVGLEAELNKMESERDELRKRAKVARTRQDDVKSKLAKVTEQLEGQRKVLNEMQQRNNETEAEISMLKNAGESDKELQAIYKQIDDLVHVGELSNAKYQKAKQLLLSALNDTDSSFRTQTALDTVLEEYERIIAAYEEQFGIRRVTFNFAPPVAYHTSSSVDPNISIFTPVAETPSRPKGRHQKSTRASRHSTGGALKGFPSTADKDTPPPRVDDGGDNVGRTLFADTPIAHVSVSRLPPSLEPAESTTTRVTESRKRKSKEPTTEAGSDDDNRNPTVTAPLLKITAFQAALSMVKIQNTAERPVHLNGYKIRNCDYNISQLLPNVMLPGGETFTIGLRPKSGPSKSASKFHMFWQDGDHGVFRSGGNGVRLIAPTGEVVSEAK